MQVFSRDSRLSLNISGATYQSSDDGMLLTVSNTADKTVQSPGNGKIKNVSTDASGKGAVELWTDGDIMISVDGFNELWVGAGVIRSAAAAIAWFYPRIQERTAYGSREII